MKYRKPEECKDDLAGWEIVIADAEAELRAIAAKRIALRASIRLFKKKLEVGEPLPEGLIAFWDQPTNA